jgi:hypothetical protein
MTIPRDDSGMSEEENCASTNEKQSLSSLTLSFNDEFPVQQQQGQQEEDLDSEGYSADRSAASMKSSSDNDSTINEDRLGLVIEILKPRRQRQQYFEYTTTASRNNHSSSKLFTHASLPSMESKHCDNRLKRKRATPSGDVFHQKRNGQDKTWSSLSNKSPVHPDIDFSFTHHVAVKDELLSATTDEVLRVAAVSHRARRYNARTIARHGTSMSSTSSTVEVSSTVPALSKAVLDYFADLRQEVAAKNARGSRKRFTSTGCSGKFSPPQLDHTAASVPEMADTVSDVAFFSDEPYLLEDALDLADTPRYIQKLFFRLLYGLIQAKTIANALLFFCPLLQIVIGSYVATSCHSCECCLFPKDHCTCQWKST